MLIKGAADFAIDLRERFGGVGYDFGAIANERPDVSGLREELWPVGRSARSKLWSMSVP